MVGRGVPCSTSLFKPCLRPQGPWRSRPPAICPWGGRLPPATGLLSAVPRPPGGGGASVTRSCPMLCDPVDRDSSVYGILQAGTLEGAAIPFSRDLPDPGIQPGSPALQGGSSPLSRLGSPRPPRVQRSQEVATQPLPAWPGCPQLLYLGPRRWLRSHSWRWRSASSADKQGAPQKTDGFQDTSARRWRQARAGTPTGQLPASDHRGTRQPRGWSTQDLGCLTPNVELLGSPRGSPAQGPPALKGWLLGGAHSPWEARSPIEMPISWEDAGEPRGGTPPVMCPRPHLCTPTLGRRTTGPCPGWAASPHHLHRGPHLRAAGQSLHNLETGWSSPGRLEGSATRRPGPAASDSSSGGPALSPAFSGFGGDSSKNAPGGTRCRTAWRDPTVTPHLLPGCSRAGGARGQGG